MKTFFTTHNNQKRSRRKLLWLELIIFFACMLIAALTEAQTVTSITPTLNETDVVINKSIQVFFDQNVSINNPNANVYLFNADDGFSILHQFQMQDAEVSVSTSVLTINPPGFLPGNTNIVLRIDFDAITGWSGILSHAFTTENESPPTMTSLSPANGATDVSVLGDLVVTFDEPVFESNSGYIQINNSDQVSAEEIIQHTSNKISVSGNQLIISDAGDADRLRLGLDYTISIVGIVKDAANYGFEGIAQGEWDFTTEDPSPPQPATLSPADGTTGIPLTGQQFTITFDEPILANSGVVFIRNSSGGIVDQINSIEMTFGSNSASFTHSGFLPPDADLYITLAGFQDPEGSLLTLTDQEFWNFSTVANDPPQIVSLSPSDEATGVGFDQNLVITFDRPFSPFSLVNKTAVIRNRQTNAVIETLFLSDPEVTISGNTITINPTMDFPEITSIYVTISGVTMNDGNFFDGITGNDSWNFTSLDTEPLTVTSRTPNDNATDVPVDTDLVINFSEPVFEDLASNLIIYRKSDDQFIDAVRTTDPEVSGLGTTTFTVDLPNDLDPGTEYYVFISNSYLQDNEGINFAGYADNEGWNFTTAGSPPDITPPSLVSFSPNDEAVNVPVDAELTITFDEPIMGGSATSYTIRRRSDDQAVFVHTLPSFGQYSGNSLTLIKSNDLPESEHLYVTIPANGVRDLNGNNFSGFSDNETWDFVTETPSGVIPQLVSTVPVNGSTDASVNSSIWGVFDVPVQGIDGALNIQIFLRDYDTDAVVGTWNVNTSQVREYGRLLKLNTSGSFPPNKHYYIDIPATRIENANDGRDFPATSSKDDWHFTTGSVTDNSAPVATNLNPAQNATDVATDANFIITLDEIVVSEGGAIRLVRTSDMSIVETISMPDFTNVTGLGSNVITIDFTNDLEQGTEYFIEFISSFNDVAGNLESLPNWEFTSESPADATPPSPVSFSPTNNAEEVAVDRWDYSITFNEPIQLTGTPGLSFQLRDASDVLITEAYGAGVSISGNTLSVDFNHDGELDGDMLEHSTFYHIEIDAGYIEDLAGNDYAGFTSNTIWQFETIEAPDNDPPTVVSLNPANGATDVALDANLIIELNEDVFLDNDAGTFELRRKSPDALVEAFDIFGPRVTGDNSTTITIDPTNDLEYGTEYYFLIGGNDVIIDSGDNAFAGFSTDADWRFTTLLAPDNTPPTVLSFNPSDEATGVSVTDDLTVTFNEPVQIWLGGNVDIRAGIQTLESIPIADGRISFNGDQVVINPSLDLPYNTEIHITISGAAIEDLAGNNFAGIGDNSTWNFTTEAEPDNSAPVVTAFSPLDDATNVATDPVLTVTFDEPVFEGLGSGNNIIIREASGTSFEFFQITDARVTGLGTNTLSLNPNASFSNGTSYYITFPASIVEDAAGNGISGWLDDQTWSFLVGTVDNTPPQAISYSPADNALNQETDIDLVLTFDEDVKLGARNVVIKDYLTDATVVTNAALSVSVNGDQVTIDPFNDLADNTHYYVEIAASSFTDLQDNPYAGILDKDTWDFVVGFPDNQAPEVTSLTPADNATGVSQDANLLINFDEPVFAGLGSGNFIIIREADATLFEYFLVTDARVTGLGTNALTLNPDSDFDPNTSYYITLPSQIVEDANDNGIAGWMDDQTWSFTTGSNDNTPPSITSMSPMDDAVDVPLDTDFTFTFDEDITFAGTGTDKRVRVFTSSGSSAGIYSINDAFSSVSGRTITINPPDLNTGESYYITIDAGYVKDLAGNDFPGLTGNTAWSFTAIDPDVTAPMVQSLSPADDATDVAMNTDLTITFDEPVFAGAGSGNNIFIRRANASAFESFQVTDARVTGLGTNTLTFNTTNDLEPNTSYYVTLPVQVVEDAEGNGIAGWLDANTWSFTTGSNDNTPPSIASMSPMDDATDVPLDSDITFTFDEDITFAGTGSDKRVRVFRASGASAGIYSINDVFSSVSGRTVTINPPDLTAGESYYITIDAGYVKDLSGNDFPGISGNTSWNFTAFDPDVTAPQVLSFSPVDNATNVAIDADLSITFDEAIFEGAGSGNNIFIRKADASAVEFFQVTDARVTGLGTNALTINPSSDLEYSTSYYVTLPAQVVEDAADNGIDGWSDATTWNFTTEAAPDNTAPSVTAFSPAHQSTDVAIDIGQLQMTFDEAIQKTNPGNIILRDFDNNIIAQYFPAFDDNEASVSGNVLTLNLPGDLDYETNYYVQFISGTIADLAGNNFPGFNNASTWIFTTEDAPDVTPPSIVSLTPADDELNVSTTANLEITFDEHVFSTNHPINVIRIVDFDTDQSVEVFDPDENGNGRVTIVGNVITLNPTNDLLHDNQYYVIFNDDILQDASGNVLAGYNNNFTWNFTTEADLSDVTAPTIVSVTPSDNSTDVDPDTNLEIQFDEDVFLGNSSFLVRYYDNNVSQYTIPYNSGDVTVSGNTVTIELPGALFGETRYWIQINANTITDAAGNGFSGILQANRDDWDFTTAGKMDQTLTFEVISDKTFGDAPFALTASASSGLPVTFDVVNGPVSISGNEVTILGTGSASIRARQEGNGEYNAAIAEIRSFNIAKADQTITFSTISDRTFGDDNFDLSPSSTSGLDVELSVVSGPISITNNTVTINGVGTAIIAANQVGDANYNAAIEVRQSFEINKANQIITIELIEDKLVSAAPFEVAASVNTNLELEYDISGPASISGTTITLNGTPGMVTVSVSQAGNENYNSASASVSFSVSDKSEQTISFEEIIDKVFGDADFDLTATASSGLSVEFSVISGPVSINGSTISITGAGTAVIAANQSGNDEFEAANEVQRSFEIAKADQTISIDPIEDKLTTDAPFEIVASVDTNLELTYEVTGPATISGTIVTLDGSAGSVTVTVSQAGSANYNASSSSLQFEVTEEVALFLEELVEVNFYPNPVTDFIIIESKKQVDVRLFSLQGRLIKYTSGSELEIDVRNLLSGAYILEIQSEKGIRKERIIKAN